MTICVVGGTGFLGRHLCQALHRNCSSAFSTSRAPDQSFLQRWAPSIAGVALDDPDLWRLIAKVDAVVYLGSSTKPGSSWRAPDKEIEFEVAETARFIRRVLDVSPACRIIYASSGGTIYGAHHNEPITEDQAVIPTTSYALGKHLTEQLLWFHSNMDRANITILRIANPVGVWQMEGRHGFVSAVVKAWRNGDEVTIYGDGGNIRDYLDADDLAEAILTVARADPPAFRVYNVSSGLGRSELDIVALVERALGTRVRCHFLPARGFDLRYSVLNPERIANDYGWSARTSLEETVRKMASG